MQTDPRILHGNTDRREQKTSKGMQRWSWGRWGDKRRCGLKSRRGNYGMQATSLRQERPSQSKRHQPRGSTTDKNQKTKSNRRTHEPTTKNNTTNQPPNIQIPSQQKYTQPTKHPTNQKTAHQQTCQPTKKTPNSKNSQPTKKQPTNQRKPNSNSKNTKSDAGCTDTSQKSSGLGDERTRRRRVGSKGSRSFQNGRRHL